MKNILLGATLALAVSLPVGAQSPEPVDLDMVGRIRQEALHRSQVMDTLNHLTEVIGPRLTNSPGYQRAADWTGQRLRDWGVSSVRQEAVDDLGRGWEFSQGGIEMLAPRALPLHALPRAWTPGTAGAVEGEAVFAKLESKADLEKFKGKLRGKVVFTDALRPYKPGEQADFHRHDAKSMEDLIAFPVPRPRTLEERREDARKYKERLEFTPLLNRFLVDEGVVGTVGISSWDNGIVRVMGGGSRKGAAESDGVPAFVMIAEHYNTVMRALDRKETVRLRLRSDARYTTSASGPGYNVIAEIPGSGPQRDEIVMIGAHLDSWHAGTGANDNGAGVAVMMEAMRILKAVGARPNRTIRIGLWTGEEQGLLGSRAYVEKHLARYPEPADAGEKALPLSMREHKGTLQKLPGYDTFSVYFNMDNGSGKIRGVYAQENMAAVPVFEAWLKPFHDLGATTVTQRNTGSTDHIAFDAVGLPGFQFVQDRLDYFSNVHHTHLDVHDHASADDLRQASAIVAAFAWNAAQRRGRFPRKAHVD